MSPREIAGKVSPSVVTIRGKGKMGSGFVVRADGWIATNAHVVEKEEHVEIVLADGRTFTISDAVAVDEKKDLAILHVQATNLPSLELRGTSDIQAGDQVMAVGNPLGLERSVSDGLVSAIRQLEDGSILFQVSVPISHGSSGGPIVDTFGRVIAVATAGAAQGQNLNFAVPARYLLEMLNQPHAKRLIEVTMAK